jgi:hypothetical protein
MTQTINRMFGSYAQAAKAVEDLKAANHHEVFLVSRSGGADAGADNSLEAITTAIMKSFVWKPHAKILAKAVKDGGSLVTVHPAFGYGREANDIMTNHSPIESGLPDHKYPSRPWDDAVPMSSALQLPVLMKNPLPMSTIWNVPAVLKKPVNITACLGLPMLSRSTTPLSSKFGWGTISKNATPLSSKFGFPTLSAPKARRAKA